MPGMAKRYPASLHSSHARFSIEDVRLDAGPLEIQLRRVDGATLRLWQLAVGDVQSPPEFSPEK
jgi:hypothetical protein